MTHITATLVKDLRERTGAGMMDAKKALVEAGGDIEAAADALRIKGLAKASKKSGRTAAEGLVALALAVDGHSGALVEVNCETDFVARNEQFQVFARDVADKGLRVDGAQELAELTGGDLTDLIATIGENMMVRRHARLVVYQGIVAGYIHAALAPNLGRIGVLVALKSSAPQDKLQDMAKQIAMHIAAANPIALDRVAVDPQTLEREKNILRVQAAESGKPPAIIEKMIEGRLRQFYAEQCLMEQPLVMNPDLTVADFVAEQAKVLATPVTLVGFARLQLGEGVEVSAKDEVEVFAAA